MAALTCVLMLPYVTVAQSSDFGNWLIYIGSKKVNSKWNIHNEIQFRNYDAIGDLEQLLLRTGVGYNLSENNHNVLLGYGYINSENYSGDKKEKITVNEHRIFQQFTTKQKLGRVGLSHRYRFEQRFVEDDFKMRFRYFLSLNINTGSLLVTSVIFFSLSKNVLPITLSCTLCVLCRSILKEVSMLHCINLLVQPW